MSLAVAITNTGAVFSESQVKNVPKTREAVPPSLPADPWVPANALSISSIQRIAGATLSAVWMARRIDSSLEPTRLPNTRADVEPQQRQLPQARGRLGAEALAASLHAQQQHSLGRRQAELRGPLAEGRAPLAEPVLEIVQPRDRRELLLALVVLQRAALADDLLLLAENDADVVGVELAVEHQGLGEYVFGLFERQAPRGVHQLLASFGVEVDADPRLVLDVVDDAIEQPVEVVDRRRAELDHGDVFGQLNRDLHDRRHEHDRLVSIAQGVGDIA